MGVVAPTWEQWRRFTFDTSSPHETILINCLSVPDYPQSVGYLRAVFFTPDPIYSAWLKFFPKPEKELYTIPIPREVLGNTDSIRRGFEIIKKPKRKPTYKTVTEGEWSVSLEVLSQIGFSRGANVELIGDELPIEENLPSLPDFFGGFLQGD